MTCATCGRELCSGDAPGVQCNACAAESRGCISLLAWIERQESAVDKDRAMFVRQRRYDLCRLMDGRTDCLWELRQWLKWEHGVEATATAHQRREAAYGDAAGSQEVKR